MSFCSRTQKSIQDPTTMYSASFLSSGLLNLCCALNKSIFVQVMQQIDRLVSCRWATQGFDFLQAIEPAFISALPEDDFLVLAGSSSFALYFAPCAGMDCGIFVCVLLQNLQALMNECIGHVIGKPHSPVTGLYIGKMILAALLLRLLSSPVVATLVLSQLPRKSILPHSGEE